MEKKVKPVRYCPQFDALSEHLTVSETIMIYCLFRNVNDPKVTVKTLMEKFDLEKYRKIPVENLSGENKRN